MGDLSPNEVDGFEEHRQLTAGELTANILMKEHERIAKRLEKEGIASEKAREVYSVCKTCAIYNKNLSLSIKEDFYSSTGRELKICYGIKFLPLLDNENDLFFHTTGECKGYVNIANFKK